MACASCCVLCVSRYWKLATAATFLSFSSVSRRYVVGIFNEVMFCREASKHEASLVVWVFCTNVMYSFIVNRKEFVWRSSKSSNWWSDIMKWHSTHGVVSTFFDASIVIFWVCAKLFFFWFVISSLRSLLVAWLQLHRHFVSLFATYKLHCN